MSAIFASPCSSSSLKRKRDDFATLQNPTQCPITSSIPTVNPSGAFGSSSSLRAEVHSRTLKRTRNKPLERDVYDYTLQKLFAAQNYNANSHSKSQPEIPASTHPVHQNIANQPKSGRDIFSSFFSSSKPQNKPPKQLQNIEPLTSPLCEDCDKPLQERELWMPGEGRCINCKRRVCFEGGCSVAVNDGWGGEGRVCLTCATR